MNKTHSFTGSTCGDGDPLGADGGLIPGGRLRWSAVRCRVMHLRRGHRAAGIGLSQFFNRYPVLTIHQTTSNNASRNPTLMLKLMPTDTSEVP